MTRVGHALRAVAPPDLEVRVVRDRMLDLVAHQDPLQVLRVLLVRELRRVHADHHELVGEALLERLQIAQHVHAVDAAVGPEVEDHDLAAQLRDRDRRGDVEPVDGAVERRRGESVLVAVLRSSLIGPAARVQAFN